MLDSGDPEIVAHVVEYFPMLVPNDAGLVASAPDAVAREYVGRPAGHRFENWADGVEALVAPGTALLPPFGSTFSASVVPLPSPAVDKDPGTPISVVFAEWRDETKAVVAWNTFAPVWLKHSINLFALFGLIVDIMYD